MQNSLSERLERAIREAWSSQDPNLQVEIAAHEDGKLEITIISSIFEGQDSFERESRLWTVLRPFSPSDLIRLTYSLLLTPAEAKAFYPERGHD
jgi:hypothetical protein